MAQYLQCRPLLQGRVGVLPSAFNPPTIAHVALADAAREAAGLDQIAFALPKRLPHKEYQDASFDERLDMLLALTATRSDWACLVTDGGLFVEMAREVKELSGPNVEALLLCGRDAAERIVGWDYQEAPPIEDQLREFGMVVAARGNSYRPPYHLADRFTLTALPDECAEVSSSSVRAAIQKGEDWRGLVPGPVADIVAKRGLYRGK